MVFPEDYIGVDFRILANQVISHNNAQKGINQSPFQLI